MPPLLPPRTPVGVLLLAWRLWRYLPPSQRRRAIRLAIALGPRAIVLAKAARSRRSL